MRCTVATYCVTGRVGGGNFVTSRSFLQVQGIAFFTLKLKMIIFEQFLRFHFLSDVGEYLLKVYAKPEAEVYGNDDRLDHVATIPIHCIQVVERHMPKISQMFLKPVLQVCVLMLFFAFQVKNRPLPYPRSDNAWGVTQAFFDTGIVLAR